MASIRCRSLAATALMAMVVAACSPSVLEPAPQKPRQAAAPAAPTPDPPIEYELAADLYVDCIMDRALAIRFADEPPETLAAIAVRGCDRYKRLLVHAGSLSLGPDRARTVADNVERDAWGVITEMFREIQAS